MHRIRADYMKGRKNEGITVPHNDTYQVNRKKTYISSKDKYL